MARRYVYDPATNIYKAVGEYRYADGKKHDGSEPRKSRKPSGDPSELVMPATNDDLAASYGKKKGKKQWPSFDVQSSRIARKEGVSEKAADAILASRARMHKATPSYEYGRKRNERIVQAREKRRADLPDENGGVEEEMSNSFGKSVRRYEYNPFMNAYIEKSVKLKTATAAANPWDLTINDDGTTDSESVGHDPEGNNHEPSRAKKKEKAFRKTSRRALFQPGEERLEKPGDDHDTGGFAPGQLVKDWNEEETPEDRKKRKRKIREQIDPEAKRHFDEMSNDDIIEQTDDGGNAMAQKFTRGMQEPVTVTKAVTNQAMIADMMAKQFGYSARQSVDAMSTLVKSAANMHAIEAGNLFELHDSGDTYVIAPIGHGPTGDLARTLPFEYVDVFENNLEKAKMRASMQQKAELRKSVIEYDSKHFHRNAVDAVLSKGYRFAKDLSQEERDEGESAKQNIRGMLGNFERTTLPQREREGASDAKRNIRGMLARHERDNAFADDGPSQTSVRKPESGGSRDDEWDRITGNNRYRSGMRQEGQAGIARQNAIRTGRKNAMRRDDDDLESSFGKASEADAVDGRTRRFSEADAVDGQTQGRGPMTVPPSRFTDEAMHERRTQRARAEMNARDRAGRDRDRTTQMQRDNFNAYRELGGGPNKDPDKVFSRSLLDIFNGKGRRRGR